MVNLFGQPGCAEIIELNILEAFPFQVSQRLADPEHDISLQFITANLQPHLPDSINRSSKSIMHTSDGQSNLIATNNAKGFLACM